MRRRTSALVSLVKSSCTIRTLPADGGLSVPSGVDWLQATRESLLGTVRCCLTAGESWIRTVGSATRCHRQQRGQTAGHTFGDAPGWWYPYLWSWGGKEVAEDGK